MRRIGTLMVFLVSVAFIACGGGSGSSPIPMGTLLVTVDDASDDSAVQGAWVAVYDDENLIVNNGTTDADGEFGCSLRTGIYYVKVTAQGFKAQPLTNQSATPFEISDGRETVESVLLETHPNAGGTGQLSGMVTTPAPDFKGVSNVLVVAEDEAQNLFASGISGPDGNFSLFNVAPGSYTLSAFRAGFRQVSDPGAVDVVVDGNHEQNDIEINAHANADLSGKVTFLAITNGIVDITLIHPDTLDTIPGLTTVNDANNEYFLQSIPPGTYLAWASFRNDGYVMDPDWVFKNGLPEVIFGEDSPGQVQDFSVTGTVTITGPTNEADSGIPEYVYSDTPTTFRWEPYASAKEYIVEVFDSQGNTIWGGFNNAGVVQHQQILAASGQENSIVFDFDGSAVEALQDGETYRWKIYADDDTALDVQTLISSSEDLVGLFTYIQN